MSCLNLVVLCSKSSGWFLLAVDTVCQLAEPTGILLFQLLLAFLTTQHKECLVSYVRQYVVLLLVRCQTFSVFLLFIKKIIQHGFSPGTPASSRCPQTCNTVFRCICDSELSALGYAYTLGTFCHQSVKGTFACSV